MSRRKQSKPRQIKRSLGDLDTCEENPPDDGSLSGDEGGASDLDDSAELDGCSPPSLTPLCSEEPRTQESPIGPDEDQEEEEERGPTQSADEEDLEAEEDAELPWTGPDELELSEGVDGLRVLASRDLPEDTVWGPYSGTIQSQRPCDDTSTNENTALTLVCEEADCWLSKVPVTVEPSEANCCIYSQDEDLFCKLTQELTSGATLMASISMSVKHKSVATMSQNAPVKEEPTYPAALHSEIQLLPQQAGMAAILATAVVNKDIFPCKDCGIWYRSERNLHAHLMYYCASRQKQPGTGAASSSPPQDKSKESYPNERICPFPQCQKSCPSASSLEIHMRTHSGERPFVCLICLSAFTTKANCERHLKVHTDTLSGVCHGCGFVSTTRDILYSHLVTSHMVCQPGGRSDVYSPGPGAPKLPLAPGLSPGDSGIVLKCQVCGAAADTPALLQQHVRTHLEVRVPAEHSPTPRQGTNHSSNQQTQAHSQPHPQSQDREPAACVPRPNSSSPGTNGGSATPRGASSPPGALASSCIRIKEEPQSDTEHDAGSTAPALERDEEEAEGQGCHHVDRDGSGDGSSSQKSTSPKSPAGVAIKAEPTSPTPGSSPAHASPGGSTLPGGVFLPQYVFGAEAAMIPQASEILAKMSEMVHSRLKQGQGQLAAATAAAAVAAVAAQQGGFYPSGSPAPPVHKGATCFECDITFNNINNFYVHKRLYCSSRHQQVESAQLLPKDPASASASASAGTPPSVGASGGSRAASASPSDTENPRVDEGSEARAVAEVKTEPQSGTKETGCSSSSEGECGGSNGGGSVGGKAISEGSPSPNSACGGGGSGGDGSTAEDPEDDPTRTFCEACNIRFSRHDNYLVHKRFYCASRHDPSHQRTPHASKAAFLPQPIRTRKRKKMYEIHMARSQALASSGISTIPALALKQEMANSPSSSATAIAGSAQSCGASPEGDGPIDLSKRPRMRGTPRGAGAGGGLPALPLSDYHKCTACSISFNSIENYLAHKTYYCPATTLQPHTLEQLQRLKRPASTSPKSLHTTTDGAAPSPKVTATGKAALGSIPGAQTPAMPLPLPGSEAATVSSTTPPHGAHAAKLGTIAPAATMVAARAAPVVCPYCPPSRAMTSDLVEHFRSAHGLVLTLQGETQATGGAAGSPSSSVSPRDTASTAPHPATSTSSASANSSPRPSPRLRSDSVNGGPRLDPGSPSSPQVNGSPSGGTLSPRGAPQSLSPSGSLTISPVSEMPLRETGLHPAPNTPPEKPLPLSPALSVVTQPKQAVGGGGLPSPAALQNGNTRYCRLCNIKFSSLSTFIAHKKYYCSSHSAEHVK